MTTIDYIISREDAQNIKNLLGLTAKEAYDKYGCKRYELPVYIENIPFGENYQGEICVEIPDDDDSTITADVTLICNDSDDVVDGDTCYSIDELSQCVLTDKDGNKYGFILMPAVNA